MEKYRTFFLFISILLVISCTSDNSDDFIEKQYEFLPENLIAVDPITKIQARYISPTNKYSHGILGDEIEAEGLLLIEGSSVHEFYLDSIHVFEDIVPRLNDIDGDGIPEIICIQTNINLGASVAVYQMVDNSLMNYDQSEYIGRAYRWLNIAAISDFDKDGVNEIVWVSTPHIGGVLRLGRIQGERIKVIDSIEGVSNHKISSRNLSLSLLKLYKNKETLYLPSNSFESVIAFQLNGLKITPVDTIQFTVDPNVSLQDQIFNPG
jgi:hypothetical protein